MSDNGEWQGRVDRRLDGVEKRLDGVEKRLDGVERELRAIKNQLSNGMFDLSAAVASVAAATATATNMVVTVARGHEELRERMDRVERMLAELLAGQKRIEGFSAGRKKKNHRNG